MNETAFLARRSTLIAIWVIGLVVGGFLIVLLNLDKDLRPEALAAIGAAVVAYFLLGVNGWFLHTLLQDLHETRSSVHREISPYVVPTNVMPDQPASTLADFENAGKGVALRCRISVFRLVDETPPFRTFVPVTLGDIQVGNGVVIDQNHTLVMAPDGTWGSRTPYQSRVLLTSFDVRKWECADDAVFVRTLCFDQEARRHERWFSVSDGSEVEELRGGNYPLGSIPEPPPDLGEIDRTARSLQTAFNTDYDDPEG